MKEGASEPLGLPGRRNPWLPSLKVSHDAFGILAESVARFMGTAKFLVWMSVFVAGWIFINVSHPAFLNDGFPFQLLTLILSIQASYAAPLILLAQNRQESRDRAAYSQDRRTAAQSRADMDYIAREISALRARINSIPTRDFVRSEVRSILAELKQLSDENGTNG